MLVLVLDTSTAAVTAALVDVGEEPALVAERVVVNARGHGELLAPQIEVVLSDAGRMPRDIKAIVAGTGPGPYTGLRVGLVTAAVMAETLGIPTYGVCSLDGLAGPGFTGLAATDARRREVYWARYENGARTDGPHVGPAADIPPWQGPAVGAGARLYGLATDGPDYPVALELARVAADRVRSNAPSERLTPLYLRHPDAVPPGASKPVTA